MARSHAAVPSGGWPTQRPAAEVDPRSARAVPAGQRPAQPGAHAQGSGYPQAGYPEQQGQAPAYDPQLAYHYPQSAPAAAPNPRQGLSSLDTVTQQAGGEYQPYPAAQAPPGHTPQGSQPASNAPDYRQAGFEPWPSAVPYQDPRAGYDTGGYRAAGAPRQGAQGEPGGQIDPLQQQPEWMHPAFADGAAEEPLQAGQMGYEQQAHAGALDQGYSHEEGGDYEFDEPRRGSWAMRIGGAVALAIVLGYGLAQGYKLMSGGEPDGTTPVVRGDSAPAKTKPDDPGGKQFAHTDSKVMGRLGEGASSSSEQPSSDLSSSDADSSGTRKVATLTVGRDGSISPPAQSAEPISTTATVAAPGLTVVDGFGGGYPTTLTTSSTSPAEPAKQPAKQEATPAPAAAPAAEAAPESKPEVVANVTPVNVTLDAPSEPAAEPNKESSPPAPPAAAPAKSSAASGYVVVLASFPVSSQSRLVALKRYADMQEKYGTVLQNKTPDVQEANLGERGNYHRLLVGPPASRAQASTLCTDLKAAGYKDCWVMAY